MTRKQALAPCPTNVLDWIAWYPDGDLPPDVRSEIETHAAECSVCRQEIADLSGEGATDAPEARGSERVFARALQKIEAHPRRVAPERQRRTWRVRPRFAIAAGIAVALISGTAGVVATNQLARGVRYEPATSRVGDAPDPASPHLDVVFRGDASFAEISSAIRALGANVESGPSPSGVVHLRLAAGVDPVAAARRLEAGDLHVADFAQPAP